MIPTNKKIAVLHPYLTKRWWAVNMMIYLSHILWNDNKVSFYTFQTNSKLFPQGDTFTIQGINSMFRLAHSIKKSDYIFIWNSPMHFVAVLSKVLFRSKAKLIWRHHHYPWYYSVNTNVYIKLKRLLEKFCIRYIDLFIVNSQYLQNSIKDIYKRDSKILYPVLGDKFLDYQITEWKNNDNKTLFSYGRRVEGKNIEFIFNTYDNLKKQIPNLVLKIWWEWFALQKYKNKYKCEENVKILWFLNIDEIIKHWETSQVFLFPSKIDSFWLVVLESMSLWLPVISYNNSWTNELVKDWVNGFLVDSESEFIEKSWKVLSDDSLRNNLSIESVHTARYFWKNLFIKHLSEIFNSI